MIFLVDTSASMANKAAEIAAFMKAIVNSPETPDHTRYPFWLQCCIGIIVYHRCDCIMEC